jgi:hypothetical protein
VGFLIDFRVGYFWKLYEMDVEANPFSPSTFQGRQLYLSNNTFPKLLLVGFSV